MEIRKTVLFETSKWKAEYFVKSNSLVVKDIANSGIEICFDNEGLAFLMSVLRSIENFNNDNNGGVAQR